MTILKDIATLQISDIACCLGYEYNMGELEEKIKKELLKSGFPLQIFCQRCLLEKGWGILVASDYFISEPDVRKQVDVIGINTERPEDKTDIDCEIFIECKKAEDNPWVFFREDKNTFMHIPVFCTSSAPKGWGNYLPDIQGLHFNNVPLSLIYTMAFKKKIRTNQIYEAISSVLLSYRLRTDFLERHKEARGAGRQSIRSILVSFLTILFDGSLYLADVGENGTIDLVETGNILYCQKEVKFPKVQYFNIEIVTKDYFPRYLDILNKDVRLISKFFKQQILKGGIDGL